MTQASVPHGSRGHRLLVVLLGLSLTAFKLAEAHAQLIAPGRELLLIATERFDIYFPVELRKEGRRLASQAEGIFDSLAPIFPAAAASSKRFPVLLADGSASLNGYYIGYPSDRIVIYAAGARFGNELGVFDDVLASVFAHELVHALSLTTRSGLWALGAAVLGDYVQPGQWAASSSLVEGAAIAFEGLGGAGRSVDPLSLALPRQDIIENRFKEFWQAAGAWDAYPFTSLPYAYGGPFADFLIERYGQEKFAALWALIGEGSIAGLEGALFLPGIFERTYGLGLNQAWKEFRDWLAPDEAIVVGPKLLAEEPGLISALAVGAKALYWADAAAGTVFARERSSGRLQRLFAADSRISRLDLSPDGAKLLVSWIRESEGKEIPILLTWDLAANRFTDFELCGLTDGAWAGNSGNIVALAPRGFTADLVLVEGGERKLLLSGDWERGYGQPSSPDGKMVYLLAKIEGKSRLLRIDLPTGQAWALSPDSPLENLRFLSLAAGEGAAKADAIPDSAGGSSPPLHLALAFAADSPRLPGLYRAALMEDGPSGPTLRLQRRALSGSVLMPALAPDLSLYYSAHLSEGEYPALYPAEEGELAFDECAASWEAIDASVLADSSAPNALNETSAPNANDGMSAPNAPTERKAPPLPLFFRSYRIPFLSSDFDAAGLSVGGEDIGQALRWNVNAAYSWGAQAADLGIELGFGLKPWELRLALGDDFGSWGSGSYLRISYAALKLARSWSFLPIRRRLSLKVSAAGGGMAFVRPGFAYAAPYEGIAVGAKATLSFSDMRNKLFPPTGIVGLSAFLSADTELVFPSSPSALPAIGVEAGLDVALPFLGAEILIRAALAPFGQLGYGTGGRALFNPIPASIITPLYARYSEYTALSDLFFPAYAFGQASLQPISVELQSRSRIGSLPLPLYFQRFQSRLGLRGALLGSPRYLDSWLGLWSVFATAELAGSPLVGSRAETRPRLGIELAYAFSAGYGNKPLKLIFLYSLGN